MKVAASVLLAGVLACLIPAAAWADGADRGDGPAVAAVVPEQEAPLHLVVTAGQAKILRTKADVYRTQVDDESVCQLAQTTPRELSVRGRRPGETAITVWLQDGRHQPVTVQVRVVAGPSPRPR